MRSYLLLPYAFTLAACGFELNPVVYQPGELPDGGEAVPTPDGPLPDGTQLPDFIGRDIPPPPPDFTTPPRVPLFSIDARSPNAWQVLAQPWLRDYPGSTIAHYRFDEMGAGALMDVSGKANHLSPVGGMFSGNRRAFTHIPAPAGAGLTRVGTEFVTHGFAAAGPTAFDVLAQDFTIEAWFKLPPGYVVTSKNPDCDPIAWKGTGPGYAVCVSAGGKLRLRAVNQMMAKEVETAVGFADGAWHYGTFVFGIAAQGTAAIYVDGKDFTPNSRDLSQPSLTNNKTFSVGENGASTSFGGSLAELAIHGSKLVTLQEHRDQYLAFGVPYGPGAPSAAVKLNYGHGSTLCTVVADDATLGDRVACYGGGGGLTEQVALARSDAASANGNPDKLGLAASPDGLNTASGSEGFDHWQLDSTSVMADTAISPRGDQTADVLNVRLGGQVFQITDEIRGNGPVTFSVWLRGRNEGDYTYLRLTDIDGKELQHCLVTLSKKWRRYSCDQVFTVNPVYLIIAIDGLGVKAPLPPMPMVTVEAWGAQLDVGTAPRPYVPNPGVARVARAPVVISVDNAGAAYLAGNAGRLELGFTPDAAMSDGSWLFDTSQPMGRVQVHRAMRGDLVAEILDGLGAGTADSPMAVMMFDWKTAHAMALAWNTKAPLAGGFQNVLTVDEMLPVRGRAAAYQAAAPATLFLLSDGSSKNQPAGALQYLTIYDQP